MRSATKPFMMNVNNVAVDMVLQLENHIIEEQIFITLSTLAL